MAKTAKGSMMRLLVINPNTGQATTDRLSHFIAETLPQGVAFSCLTAKFGFPYIASEESYAVASHAVLATWQAFKEASVQEELPQRILLGCFGDPGLFAMREICTQPVTALAEASFVEASRLGDFAIVTGGARWRPMLQRLAMGLGYGGQLKVVHTVEQTGAQLLADPVMAREILTQACRAAEKFSVKTIILGGAGLAGYAAMVQPHVSLPIIDSVEAGVRYSLAM
jgi:allantoin racemase